MSDKYVNNRGNEDQTPSRIFGIIAIIAGILVMISGYIVYNYFNQSTAENSDKTELSQIQIALEERNNEIELKEPRGLIGEAASTTRFDEVEIKSDSFGITPTLSVKPNKPAPNESALEPRDPVPEIMPSSSTTDLNSPWTANNYQFGDIETGDYTVISGDTLWEIAEAVYGNGSDWQKIANANNVDYLANGNPLIVPGQVLSIPT